MTDFAAARAETVRYHQEFYAAAELGQAGTWLSRPQPLIISGLDRIDRPVRAYDLGAGVGRHSIALAQRLPAGSRVVAVDLLDSALERLRANARRAGVADQITTVQADLHDFEFPAADAGLIVAFSALEHLPSTAALTSVLGRCRDATVPGGLNIFGVLTDRHEDHGGTDVRPAQVELPMTASHALAELSSIYSSWEIEAPEPKPISAVEHRVGARYVLRAQLVPFTAQRPGSLSKKLALGDRASNTGPATPGQQH